METQNDSGSDFSLLYVEDDHLIRKSISLLLLRKFPKLKIHTAENGKTGLELFKKQNPCIVLTDINMPLMNGIRMATEILALKPDAAIIVCSAYSDAKYLSDAYKIGISRYILKPIDLRLLFEVIEDCMNPQPGRRAGK